MNKLLFTALVAAWMTTWTSNIHPSESWELYDRTSAENDFIFCETMIRLIEDQKMVFDKPLDGINETCHSNYGVK